jgi:predicted protein tyrosine phosphatase
MQFQIFTRGAIESLTAPDAPYVVISITSVEKDKARLPASANCLGVLRLAFPDADRPGPGHPERSLFSVDQARQVWSFVLAYRERVERVLLHCDAGQCRSPAVAAALAKALEGQDEEFFRRYRPNMRVYRMLLETYHAEYAPPPAPAAEPAPRKAPARGR